MSNDDSDLDLLLDEEDDSPHQGRGDDYPRNDEPDDRLDLEELDDSDEEEEQSRRTGRPVPGAKKEEEEEEEEEDEDDEPVKGKGINPVIMLGAAISVVALAGVGGYVVLNKGSSDEQPMVTTSMPAPSIDDLGKDVNVPSTNLASPDVENAIYDEAPEAPVASSPAVKVPTPPVGLPKPEILQQVTVAPVETKLPPVVEAPTSLPVVAVLPSVAQSEQPHGDTVTITSPNADMAVEKVSADQVNGLVAKAVQEAGDKLNDDLGERLAAIQKTVDQLNAAKLNPAVNEQSIRAKVIAEIREDKENKAKEKADLQRAAIEDATKGKQRIPGFQVINATSDGTISIIKAPSGGTFALFKGEKFRSNGSVLEVQSIISDGKLVVAGDSWFIDETLVEVPKAVVKQARKSGNSSGKTDAVDRPVAKKVKVSALSGWSLHATFEGGGYLVKKPSGEYVTVQKGEYNADTGKVTGIDAKGDLVTEKGIIKGDM